MKKKTYAPKLPLYLDKNKDFFMIDSILSNIKQKMKMLFLTTPGEKIMDPDFGIGIKRFLFEPTSGLSTVTFQEDVKKISVEDYNSSLSKLIKKQVSKYLTDIALEDVILTIENDLLQIEINYSYNNYFSQTLVLEVQ